MAVGPDGSVYVADTWNHRIQKFNPEGEFLLSWRGSSGEFFGPRELVVSPDNKVHVVDTGNKRVQIYSPRGEFIGEWGVEGEAPGCLIEPVGIAVGNDGRIYLADTGNSRIQVFGGGKEHECQQIWKVPDWNSLRTQPYLALDSKGRLFATNSMWRRIYRFSTDGQDVYRYNLPPQGSAIGLRSPMGIAFDADDNLYIADRDSSRVLKVRIPPDPEG